MIAVNIMILLLLMAVWFDFSSWRIPNSLLLVGTVTGSVLQIWYYGFQGLAVAYLRAILVIFLLFLFFHMRALGAGDIKLLSMTSLFLQGQDYYYCVLAAFFTAGLFSALKLMLEGNLWERLGFFYRYLIRCAQENTIVRYREGAIDRSCSIHFSLAVLVGYLLYLEVIR